MDLEDPKSLSICSFLCCIPPNMKDKHAALEDLWGVIHELHPTYDLDIPRFFTLAELADTDTKTLLQGRFAQSTGFHRAR